jgi:hypothetical protein
MDSATFFSTVIISAKEKGLLWLCLSYASVNLKPNNCCSCRREKWKGESSVVLSQQAKQ